MKKSALKMLVPADGIEGVKKFVVDTVKAAGSSPCPPMVVGVGIGGTLELAACAPKRAAMRDVDTPTPIPGMRPLRKSSLGLPERSRDGPAGARRDDHGFQGQRGVLRHAHRQPPGGGEHQYHAARHAEAEL